MDTTTNGPTPAANAGRRPSYTPLAWVVGCMIVLAGFVQGAAASGWRDQSISGAIMMVGGFLVIPPILSRIRRWTWTKPVWVPVAYVIVIVGGAQLIGSLFTPSGTELDHLRTSAIARAEQLLAHGDLGGARFELRRFRERPDPGGHVAATLHRIEEAAERAAAQARVKAQQETQSTNVAPASQSASAIDFPHLRPANRFSEYAVGETYRAAQDALNAGDVAQAYNAFGARDRSLDGPRERRFDEVLETAFQQWSNTSPGSNFAERVQTYWLPQLRALPLTPPADIDAYGARVTALGEFAQDVRDGQGLTLTSTQSHALGAFRAALSAKQVALYPILRRRYAELLGQRLFRNDVRVAVSGPRAQTLRLTSYTFVRNADIEDMQVGLASDLAIARFRRVEYRWSPYLNDGYHYDLHPPADREVTAR